MSCVTLCSLWVKAVCRCIRCVPVDPGLAAGDGGRQVLKGGLKLNKLMFTSFWDEEEPSWELTGWRRHHLRVRSLALLVPIHLYLFIYLLTLFVRVSGHESKHVVVTGVWKLLPWWCHPFPSCCSCWGSPSGSRRAWAERRSTSWGRCSSLKHHH